MTGPHPAVQGALTSAMMALAGTPEHASGIDDQMTRIATLTAERVPVASYASITALRGRARTTVAVSNELIRAVDEAQYADDAGPCLAALDSGTPVGVPDITAAVQWPKFHEAAPSLGLCASVSVPLFVGRGEAIAVLNVYGHDSVAMAPLIIGVCNVHAHPSQQMSTEGQMGPGCQELVTGYLEALNIRAEIRLANQMIRAATGCATEDAYLSLCLRAAEAGTDLAAAAATVIHRGP